jgi:L-ascorbate metabolism protein UlaG (beta-lactamase superfamily)
VTTRAEVRITYIGGPTAIVEVGGLRLLTDPTFDPAGTDYATPAYTLRKTQSPARGASEIGAIDAVLLSHDHHFDNLDHAGRQFLSTVPATYTTAAGAERLGGTAVPLVSWQSAVCRGAAGQARITATPARHGPAGGDRGPCVGFVIETAGAIVYVSGDTVWFRDLEPVGHRFAIDVALLNLGAAKVAAAGPHALTFTADDAVQLARAWPRVEIVPLHFEGWEHFTEGRRAIEPVLAAAGLAARVHWPLPGQTITLPIVRAAS